ncbi:unnamed protein product [Symbiodinium sp. CCMP2592]|nr:unnamed protein product [Symbiodinium sp. CCMP2592]
MMVPFPPQTKKAEVVERDITKTIEERILGWHEHATIIAGRFGAGKSVAVEEALRDMQGVYVHQVRGNDWEEKLYKRLGLDGPDMLEEVLRRVGDKLKRPPILLLDIPRTTKQGMETISSFAKELSSDRKLAHVIVCASSAAMAISFDAGGSARQKDIWVGDLTEKEAKELLTLRGHQNDWKQFVDACGFNALDLVDACDISVEAKKAEMEQKARKEVLRFKDQCKIAGDTGKEILNKLLENRQAGEGAEELCTDASPKDVAMWIREKGYHAVIWHTVKREYQFASELHANAATEILKSTSQSTP